MRHARDLRCTVCLERARTRVVQDVAPQTHAREDPFVKPRRKDLSVHCHRLPPVALSSLYRLASRDVRILAGSRNRWTEAGNAWTTNVSEPAETSYVLSAPSSDVLASRQDVESAIGTRDISCSMCARVRSTSVSGSGRRARQRTRGARDTFLASCMSPSIRCAAKSERSKTRMRCVPYLRRLVSTIRKRSSHAAPSATGQVRHGLL